jgi:hypothetical protein
MPMPTSAGSKAGVGTASAETLTKPPALGLSARTRLLGLAGVESPSKMKLPKMLALKAGALATGRRSIFSKLVI